MLSRFFSILFSPIFFLYNLIFNNPAVDKFLDKHSGAIFSVVSIIIALFFFTTGTLGNLDDYLTAVVYQMGYQYSKPLKDFIIVKKDERTSALMGANPGRREFASVIRLLGKKRTQSLNFQETAEIYSYKFLEFKIGMFKAGKEGAFSFPFFGISGSDETRGEISFFQFSEKLSRLFLDYYELTPELLISSTAAVHNKTPVTDEIGKAGQKFFSNLIRSFPGLLVKVAPKPDTVLQFTAQMNVDNSRTFEIPSAKVIGFDFLLQGNKTQEEDDLLEAAIKNSEAPIVLAGQAERETKNSGANIDSWDATASEAPRLAMEAKLETVEILPQAKFAKEGTSLGFINVAPNNKGYVSRVPLFIFVPQKGIIRPTFCLSVAAKALDRDIGDPEKAVYEKAMNEELERIQKIYPKNFKGGFHLHDIFIPTDQSGNMFIYFIGSTKPPKRSTIQTVGGSSTKSNAVFPSFSFYECFDEDGLAYHSSRAQSGEGELSPRKAHSGSCGINKNFGNRICLLGPFERSDFDFFPTPMSDGTPFQIQKELLMGIEIHANAVANIIEKKFRYPPFQAHSSVLLIFSTLLLGFLIDHMRPVSGLFTSVSFLAGIFSLSYYSYNVRGQILFFSPFMISFPMTWALTTFMNYVRQRQKANTTKAMFSRFVSKDAVQFMIDHPELIKPGGQKIELTIFFSDVAGFTTISEMLSPDDLVILMNEYLGAMTELLDKHGGTLDKYIGDAVMAFWNAPILAEDHAVKACQYAIEMQQVIKELQKSWLARGLPKAYARAGINTATVVVGYMGASDRMNYTCLGDGVNLASRLEGANKEYGTLVMVSDATYQKAKHMVTGRFLDFLAVKGKNEPVKVFELVCEKGKEPPGFIEKIALYDRAIQLHNERKWDEAIATFETILASYPDDGPSKTYSKRCQEYKETPPPDKWDLSYHLTHK